ncbi:hypothetical protein FQZ97_1187260 [compost metagenome]
MPGIRAEADQETGEVAVAFCDAEVLGLFVEAADLGRIQRQDRQSGIVVEG